MMQSTARACLGCLARPTARSALVPTFSPAFAARLSTSAPLYKKKAAVSEEFEEESFDEEESESSPANPARSQSTNDGADYASLHATLAQQLAQSTYQLKSTPPSSALLRRLLALAGTNPTPEMTTQTTDLLQTWRKKGCDLSERNSKALIRSFAATMPATALEIFKRRDLYGYDLPNTAVRQLMEALLTTEDPVAAKASSLLLLDLARFHFPSQPLDGYSLLLACKIGAKTQIKDSVLEEMKSLGKDAILDSIMGSGKAASKVSLEPIIEAVREVAQNLGKLAVTGDKKDAATTKLFEELQLDLGVLHSRVL